MHKICELFLVPSLSSRKYSPLTGNTKYREVMIAND